MPDKSCPVCGSTLSSQPRVSERLDASLYDCPRCGKYCLNELVRCAEGFNANRHLVSAWIRRQNNLGNRYPLVGGDQIEGVSKWFDDLQRAGFPQGVGEKLDALLLAYADIVKDEYERLFTIDRYPSLPAEVAARRGITEIVGLNQLLEELGYISCEPSQAWDYVHITAKGWFRINELRHNSEPSDSAFLAMWFDDCLDKYRQATVKAVSHCGYKPITIDQHDFNGFVMEQVISLIRGSRFLIADLSCKPELDDVTKPKVRQGVRGGVYWEAGIAYGMGKVVIQTCQSNDESKRRVHFDLDQYQTIFWTEAELTPDIRDLAKPISNPNFAEKLAQRIIATVGRGGHRSD